MNFRQRHPELFYKRHAVSTGQTLTAFTMVMVILASATFIAIQLGIIPPKLSSVGNPPPVNPATGCVGNFSPPSGFICTQLGVNWVFSDALAGGPVSGVTLIAYNPTTGVSVDSPSGTSSSAGALSSVSNWNSGTQFLCKESGTGMVTAYIPCTVPANPQGNTALTTITAPLPIVKTGTWALTATLNNGGTSWSSSFSNYSFLNQGTTQVVVSWQLSETVNNKGYLSSFDNVVKQNNVFVVELKSASTPKTTAQGCEFGTTYNNIVYCQYVAPDGFTTISGSGGYGTTAIAAYFPTTTDGRINVGTTSGQPSVSVQSTSYSNIKVTGSLSQQFIGTSAYPLGNSGSVYFSTTFGAGSLSSASESWTVTCYTGADVWYFDGIGGVTQGTYGADKAGVTLSPSWSTLTLFN